MQDIEFVALDCETTGLDPEKDNVIEVGAVKFSIHEGVTDRFQSFCKVETKIPAIVVALTRISDDDLIDAPRFAEVQNSFAEFVGDAILVGHNLKFDTDFLAKEGLDLRSRISFDTFPLAQLVLPRDGSLSLEALAEAFGFAHPDAHRADADAEATAKLFRKLVAVGKNYPVEKWQQILALQTSEEAEAQRFSTAVLAADIPPIEPPREIFEIEKTVANSKLADTLADKPKLLETTATAAEFANSIDSGTIFVGNNFDARKISAALDFSILPVAGDLVDREKFENLIARPLSSLEASLAAKIILHSTARRDEIYFSRAENHLFEIIASEEIPATPAGISIAEHAALPNFDPANRAIVLDSLELPENLRRANSITLDLALLESLAPAAATAIQIFWGTLGMLYREAAPEWGVCEFADVAGLSNFVKAKEAGINFLEAAEENLPPRIVAALTAFLSLDENFAKQIRSSAENEITIVVTPRAVPLPEFTNATFVDAAMSFDGNFDFARKTLGLAADATTAVLMPEKDLPIVEIVDSLPLPNFGGYQKALEKLLLEKLSELEGVTTVLFGNRRDAGNFQAIATAKLDHPVFARKFPSPEKLESAERAAVLLTSAARTLPRNTRNLILVKLPFFVRDGADWMTETLPASVLRTKKIFARFAALDSAEKFIALDSRLTQKRYGQNFVEALK